jgi:small-conductance mechanosensitive channel/CRP-like cAMP-binding protein
MLNFADWMLWGIALLVLFPLLVVGLGELADDLAKIPSQSAFTAPLLIVRNGVLPMAFASILMRNVAGISSEHLAVKLVDTVLWIIVLNAAIAFGNILFFNDRTSTAGRVRIPKLLLDIFRIILVVCGAAMIISTIWGVDLGSLVTALGVGSVVIGLALQDTLGSLFSGIAIVSARTFRVGDWVRFGTDEGLVLSQNWRSVTIKTRGGDALVIPNGTIARAPLTVRAAGAGSTSVSVDLRFPYCYSPDLICAMLSEAAIKTTGFHLDPPPTAKVASFEDNGIRYSMGVRVLEPQKIQIVRSEFLTNVWFLAQRSGIAFAAHHNINFPVAPADMPSLPTSPAALQDRLRATPGFSFGSADLMTLVAHARIERFRGNQILLAAGSAASTLYIVLSGRGSALHVTDNGNEILLHEFEPGQLMLAKASLRAAPMPFTLRAVSALEVMAVPVADFKAFCASEIALAQEIEQILSAREDAATRTLARQLPDQAIKGNHGDRAQLMQDLFRS